MRGLVGSVVRMVSLSWMRCAACGGRDGMKFLMLPLGMCRLLAVWMACLSVCSALCGSVVGSVMGDRRVSAVRLKASQSAFLKFVRVRECSFIGLFWFCSSVIWIVMGRWSELSVVCVFHVVESAMSGEQSVMSGEVGVWLVGALVWVFVLRVHMFDCEIWVAMSEPLASVIVECQRLSCALMSPVMSVVVVWLWRMFCMFGV